MQNIYDTLLDRHRKCTKSNVGHAYRHYAIFLHHGGAIKGGWGDKLTVGVNSAVPSFASATTHAEIDALNKINFWKGRPKKVDLVVIRFSKHGVLGDSRPCYHCLARLMSANIGIKHVYYSTRDGTIVKENFKTILDNPITYISSGFRKRNKTNT